MSPSAYLLLSVLLFAGAHATKEADFCIEQPAFVYVRINDSVTLPCVYSYPSQEGAEGEVSVTWRAGPGDRCGNASVIYNENKNETHVNYTDRLTLLDYGKDRRSRAIQIVNLTPSDVEQKYCCRISITLPNGPTINSTNKHMTKLVLADSPAQNQVDQMDAIPALVGESVTIPCRFTYQEKLNLSTDVTVRWTAGKHEGCLHFKDNPSIVSPNTKFTLVEHPRGNGSFSLEIANLKVENSKRYCCNVTINKNTHMQSSRGTILIVGDLKSMEGYSVNQRKHITAQVNETVKLACDFKHPKNIIPLWIGVYLTVGDKLKTFAYHSDQDFIHPDFGRRTHLIRDDGLSSRVAFQIETVTERDSKTYYCLVAFRYCSGKNVFTSVIQRGGGTRLTLRGPQGPSLTIIFLTAAAITFMLIFVVVLLLKRKGVICARSAPVQKQFRGLADPPEDVHLSEYAEISPACITPKAVDSIVYATLDLTDKTKDAAVQKLNSENEMLYSTVRLT